MEKRLEKFSFEPKNFKKGKKIGSGASGSVYKVQHMENKEIYAVKEIKSPENENDKKMINREISIMIRMQHPTIIKFHGFSLKDFDGDDHIMILLDYAEKGSLADYLNKVREGREGYNLDDTARQKILVGVAFAMMYLHRHNVIHRDLKPGNILLDENLEPHVSDFGISRFYSDVSSTKTGTKTGDIGTLIYMAPEVMNDSKYDIKADVYSFGILMYQIVTNSKPYPDGMTPYQFMNKIISENLRPKFDVQPKESLKLLIEQCWSSDPKKRPSFEEIFFKLAFNDEYPVYNFFEDEEEKPKYYLDNVDRNELISYVNEIIDDNIISLIQIKKLKDKIKNLEQNMNQIDDLVERVHQLEEDNHRKDDIINQLNGRLQNTKIYKKKRDFPYDPVRNNAFDGVMKYLGDVCGGNVDDHGIVKVYMPTLLRNDLKYSAKHAADVQNETNYAQSENEKDSYLSYDFMGRRFLPDHYSIRSRHDGGNMEHNNHLQTWKIEGSNTGLDWVILDEQNEVKYLDDVNASHTFNISKRYEYPIGYRFLRIRQTGVNTKNQNYLTIAALEFFGSLFELE